MTREERSARGLRMLAATCLLLLVVAGTALWTLVRSANEQARQMVASPAAVQVGEGAGSSAAGGATGVAAAEPEEPAPVTISLLAAGDVVVHSPVWSSGEQPDGSYGFDHLFAPIAEEARAADLALISQETILGGTELGLSGYPNFNGPTEIGDAEVAAGFDVMLKATNHVLDKGERGIENELAFWAGSHPEIAVVGMGTTQESYDDIYVYEQDGLSVALLSYTYDTNGIPFPEGNPWATHLLDYDHEAEVRSDIARARELADLVIVWPHWGTEYQPEPDGLQSHFAEVFTEEGVDVVIGSHPHTIGPVEVREREDGHRTLVFYSLGNFMSNQIEGVMTSVGAMVRLTLVKDADGAHVGEWVFEPTVTQRASGADFAVWRLADYTDKLAAANRTPLSVQACEDWCSQVLGSDYDQATSTLSGTLG